MKTKTNKLKEREISTGYFFFAEVARLNGMKIESFQKLGNSGQSSA
jgi:cytidylate kinase